MSPKVKKLLKVLVSVIALVLSGFVGGTAAVQIQQGSVIAEKAIDLIPEKAPVVDAKDTADSDTDSDANGKKK